MSLLAPPFEILGQPVVINVRETKSLCDYKKNIHSWLLQILAFSILKLLFVFMPFFTAKLFLYCFCYLSILTIW